MKRKWHQHVKHLVVPHEGNNFRPGILSAGAILSVLFLALVLEGSYLFVIKVADKDGSLLASVLPSALVALTNADRADIGAGELTENAVLTQAAQLKADDMAAKGYFAHMTPDGKQPWYWLETAGYHYTYAGENLAVNFEDSKDVEEAWMNSPTHYANIIKPQYTEVGIATARGTYKGKEVTFVVQFFASPKIAAAPVAEEVPASPVAAAPEATPETTVLGDETAPAPLTDIVVEAAASPSHTVTFALTTLAGIVALMLLVAIAAHIKMPYVEALGGTFALLVLVVGLMTFNVFQMPTLEIPNQAAAVILSQ